MTVTIPQGGAFDRPVIRILAHCTQTMLGADPDLEAIAVSIGFNNSVKGETFKAGFKYEGLEGDEDRVDLLPLVRRFERLAAKAGHDLPLGDEDASPTLAMLFGRDRIDLRVGEEDIDISLVAERVGGDWRCSTVIDASLENDYPLSDVIADPARIYEDAMPASMRRRDIGPGDVRIQPLPDEGIWRITLPIDALRLGGGEMWGGTDD